MGVFGYEEHENDDFLDFVQDSHSEKYLLSVLKKKCNIDKVVGILNILSPKARQQVDKNLVAKAITYLQAELHRETIGESERSWQHKGHRIEAIKRQLNRIGAISHFVAFYKDFESCKS